MDQEFECDFFDLEDSDWQDSECKNIYTGLNEGIFHFIDNKCYFNYQYYGTIKKVQKKKITIKKLDGNKQVINI